MTEETDGRDLTGNYLFFPFDFLLNRLFIFMKIGEY